MTKPSRNPRRAHSSPSKLAPGRRMGQHTLRALFSRDAAIPKTLPISSSTSPDARDGTLPDSGVGPPNQLPGPETAPSPASHMDLDDSRVAPRPAAPGTVPWPNEPTASVPPPLQGYRPSRSTHSETRTLRAPMRYLASSARTSSPTFCSALQRKSAVPPGLQSSSFPRT